MEPIRLLLLDDHVLFRESLSRLLASEPDFEMAGHCGTVSEALELLRRTPVDVLLLDFDLGGDLASHFGGAARAAGFEGKILMVTAGMSAAESSFALTNGASGIFLKHSSPGLLAQAIRMVASGQMWVDPKIVRMLAEGVPQREDRSLQSLLTTQGAAGAAGAVRRADEQGNRGAVRRFGKRGEGYAAAVVSEDKGADEKPVSENRAGIFAGADAKALNQRA